MASGNLTGINTPDVKKCSKVIFLDFGCPVFRWSTGFFIKRGWIFYTVYMRWEMSDNDEKLPCLH